MRMDEGDYRLDGVSFGEGERRLVRRYLRALDRVADGRWVARERLYFAAASAVECLRLGREDAIMLRRAGADPREVAEGRAIARADAAYYLGLAMAWIDRSHLRAA
jgi:hypothetical protein